MTDERLNRELCYSRLEGLLGTNMALYCMCAVFDKPYIADNDAESWEEYLSLINAGDSFADGETDVNAAMLAGMDQQELWNMIWGGDYSETDYKRLDELYHIITSNLNTTGGVDAQQQHAARECAMMNLESEKLLRGISDRTIPVEEKKNYTAVMKDLNKMASDKLKEAEMRKTDVPRSAQQRVDGFIKQLEKEGLAPDMTEDDVFEWFIRKCREKKYPITTDAADFIILSIQQTMAKNNDTVIPMDLEDDMSVAAFESEFAAEPNEREKEVYNYLGLSRGSAVNKGKTDGNGDEI